LDTKERYKVTFAGRHSRKLSTDFILNFISFNLNSIAVDGRVVVDSSRFLRKEQLGHGSRQFIEEIECFIPLSIKRSMVSEIKQEPSTGRRGIALVRKSHFHGARNISHSTHYGHRWDCAGERERKRDLFLGDFTTCRAFKAPARSRKEPPAIRSKHLAAFQNPMWLLRRSRT